jgi:hypothetical protein
MRVANVPGLPATEGGADAAYWLAFWAEYFTGTEQAREGNHREAGLAIIGAVLGSTVPYMGLITSGPGGFTTARMLDKAGAYGMADEADIFAARMMLKTGRDPAIGFKVSDILEANKLARNLDADVIMDAQRRQRLQEFLDTQAKAPASAAAQPAGMTQPAPVDAASASEAQPQAVSSAASAVTQAALTPEPR